MLALEKLCNQKKFLSPIDEIAKKLGNACDRLDLCIKCKDSNSCASKKKKKHFKKHDSSKKFNPKKFKKKKWKFLYKKKFRGKSGTRCFICNKKGHYAKAYPKQKKKEQFFQQLSQYTDVSDFSNVESVYSLTEEQTPHSLFAIHLTDSESDTSYSSDDEQSATIGINGIFASHDTSFLSQPVPAAPVSIRLSKFSKPYTAIAFFDTGAAASIINPKLLPHSHWESCSQQFQAANGAHSEIDRINKPILIQLFPTLTIQHRVFGSSLSGKDLIIGFDILHTISHLRWTAEGLRYKNCCLPWSSIPNLYIHHIDPDPFSQITYDLLTYHCADSHSEFLTKHPNPL